MIDPFSSGVLLPSEVMHKVNLHRIISVIFGALPCHRCADLRSTGHVLLQERKSSRSRIRLLRQIYNLSLSRNIARARNQDLISRSRARKGASPSCPGKERKEGEEKKEEKRNKRFPERFMGGRRGD